MYLEYITKAQEMLDAIRKAALDYKGDGFIGWAWGVTTDLIKVEAHVTDFEVIYVLSDLESGITTNSYSEAVSALGRALIA